MNSRSTLTLAGFLLVGVSLVACGGSMASNPASPTPTSPPTQTPTPVGNVTLTIVITGMNGRNSFSPNPSSIVAGQTVAFRNADSVTHTASADNGAFDTGNIGPGATSAPITMSASGAFNYHCRLHPDMVGTLTVTS